MRRTFPSSPVLALGLLVATACSSATPANPTVAATKPTDAPKPAAAAATLPATAAPTAVAAAAPTAAATSAAGAASQKKKLLGIVTFSGTDVTSNQVVTEIQKAATAGGWESTVVDANGNVDQGNSAIQNLVQRKVDGLVVTVFASTSLASGLSAAKQAAIPVVSHGGGLADGVGVAFDANGGAETAERVAKDLGGKGSALAFTYRPGLPCQERESSFDEVAPKYPDLKVTKQEVAVPGFVESAANFTTAWLTSHPSGSGNLAVWGCWDGPAEGAISALKQGQRTDVKVYGHNADADALAAIKSGSMVASMWYDSAAAGSQEFKALQEVVAGGASWKPVVRQVPQLLVDATNIDQFMKDHPEATKPG